MRMQMKLTSAFVFVGLFSCLLVGSIAFYMVKSDFHTASQNHAFEMFQADFVAYVKTYGDLDAARKVERFDSYVRRNHLLAPPDAKPDKASQINRWQNPPFKHLVVDVEGVVIHPAGGLEMGDKVSQEIMDQAVPVMVEGEVVAMAHPVGEETLTPLDRQYLSAVKNSIIQGSIIAVGLCILLGLVFGRALSRAVLDLTRAIRMMREDQEEYYQVEVTSDDELGELTEAYNEMNRELANAHRELRELAILDPLTNVYNRRHFDEQARQFFESAKRYEQPMSVMIGDLDHFKRVNDQYSHEIGDLVLEKVAELFEQNTRKSDVVARYGGEEFVVLFANTDREHAAISCEKIRSAIEAYPWDELHPGLAVTVSMGLCDETGLGSAQAMINQADKHLYIAKDQGRNRMVME